MILCIIESLAAKHVILAHYTPGAYEYNNNYLIHCILFEKYV